MLGLILEPGQRKKCEGFYHFGVAVKTKILLAFAALVLTACPASNPSPQPRVIPAPDSDLLGAMCKHLGPKAAGGLGCEEGNPIYDSDVPGPVDVPNVSCEAAYKKLQDNGVWLNPKCVLKVTDCDQIEAARKSRCE
jgi:hypothetical protein